jgi:protein phosphatase methylesterase 1
MQNTSNEPPECPVASTSSSSWNSYFESRRSVHCPHRGATFNVYLAGSTGPVVLCLHGGGYTGLTWAIMASQLKDTCQIVAPDLRGHGLTVSENDLDLSAETLAADVAALWNALYSNNSSHNSSACDSPPLPPTLIVGHSMGGAIAVHTASLNTKPTSCPTNTTSTSTSTIPTLEGIVVIDVVEGTAMSSLPFMKTVLQKRPGSFPSPSAAVEWALETGFSRNAEAAAISVPEMLKKRGSSSGGGGERNNTAEAEALAAKEAAVAAANAAWNISSKRKLSTSAASELEPISEQQQQQRPQAIAPQRPPLPPKTSTATTQSNNSTKPSSTTAPSYLKTSFGTTGAWVWRTPLEESALYWEGWYRGLSTLYLNLKIPKMLILAGTDRLDRELTIGQMQGKFQLVLLSRAGHAVHEDEAGEVSAAVKGFLNRFKIGREDKSLGVPGIDSKSGGGSLFRVPENKAPEEQRGGEGPGFSRFRPT